jgi:hypothetical protein
MTVELSANEAASVVGILLRDLDHMREIMQAETGDRQLNADNRAWYERHEREVRALVAKLTGDR